MTIHIADTDLIVEDFFTLITKLQHFWHTQGCAQLMPYDLEMGAGTFNPNTLLKSLGNKPWNVAYLQPCRRPTDGRYGDSPNRLQHYFQFQVLMKPFPSNIKELYLQSLQAIGLELTTNDVRFVEDNWESPTLGAFGLGWEVWFNGMEITQFTYFQQVAGYDCELIPVEITYGLERIALQLFNVNSVFDIPWNKQFNILYGDLFLEDEKQFSDYNFNHANIDHLMQLFNNYQVEVAELIDSNLVTPAYHLCIKASHVFNLLDARGAIGNNERNLYISKIRNMVKSVASLYLKVC